MKDVVMFAAFQPALCAESLHLCRDPRRQACFPCHMHVYLPVANKMHPTSWYRMLVASGLEHSGKGICLPCSLTEGQANSAGKACFVARQSWLSSRNLGGCGALLSVLKTSGSGSRMHGKSNRRGSLQSPPPAPQEIMASAMLFV